jgi:hypothetical protein
MRQCDRLRQFGGTTADFYGFTEVNYPTWELEEWDPTQRPCLIPDAHVLATDCTGVSPCIPIQGTSTLLPVAAALTRVQAFAPVVDNSKSPPKLVAAGSAIHIGAHFGPGNPCCDYDAKHRCANAMPGSALAPQCNITADATDCDLNGDGKIDRTTPGSLELVCANACQADLECSEYANFKKENQFNIVVQALGVPGANGTPNVTNTVDIQGDGSSDAQFNPVLLKGASIGSFTGALTYFSGGAQFTIQARCADDIVLDPNGTPIPSDTACVHARTIINNDTGN